MTILRALQRLGARADAFSLPSQPLAPKLADLLAQKLRKATPGAPPGPPPVEAAGGRLIRDSFTCAAGTRPYLLFVPAPVAPVPALIVMLHGCTQTAEDFAAGTRMNILAAKAGALVLYPIQVAAANPQLCWNWFQPDGQARDAGEAAVIASMTRHVAGRYGADPGRVFAAGLSAGGAQAAILGATHPDLFAAIGVHSGLACGAATDLPGALAAMRQGRPGQGRHRMRTIIFHGDRDQTVHVQNASEVAGQVQDPTLSPEEIVRGTAPGGLAWTRTRQRDTTGRPALERWIVHGAGHAWSGGSAGGSFTEPNGPDASAAMLAFFGV